MGVKEKKKNQIKSTVYERNEKSGEVEETDDWNGEHNVVFPLDLSIGKKTRQEDKEKEGNNSIFDYYPSLFLDKD